ncbi:MULTISPECIES: DUF1572 family protein [unclassified Exiguobacterium]|uniref:DUF1572 family protein n=1 Tax=unclassified Exiguobacterium TaxID=2644629 RepID=UPI00103A9102|nr:MULTISPECIES: DUF1572 family protein [unclassified Exiguobacterium]TCI48013.1 DUF1572 domain-containing protein [Exiguobacterium sp. SH5S32]TCI54897.1 DUF1572 domain-containing protein [Exiguobacterium sp. SH1S4]TCI74693.1 DUF1572 domain-containing protein [Exiguobacterium sp. SH1S1]
MFEQRYLTEVRSIFQEQKQLAERALNQVSDDDLHRVLAPDTLSLAVIVQHISNNMLSRWTDFLTTDGEKPDRNRDAEFEDQQLSRTELMATWDERWQLLDDVLASLTPDDIGKTVFIRGEEKSVIWAIEKQVSHYSYHVGQIVYLAKVFAGESWSVLTIPLPHQR